MFKIGDKVSISENDDDFDDMGNEDWENLRKIRDSSDYSNIYIKYIDEDSDYPFTIECGDYTLMLRNEEISECKQHVSLFVEDDFLI